MPGWFHSSLAEKNAMRRLSAHFFRSLAFVLLLIAVSYSQPPTDEDHDVILLKDGGIARGRIVETVEGKHVVLQVSNDRIIKIDVDDIALITDSHNYKPPTSPPPDSRRTSRTVMYQYIIQAAVLSGEHSTNGSVSLSAGPRLGEAFHLSFGVRFDRYSFSVLSGQVHAHILGDMVSDNRGFKEFFMHVGVGYGQIVRGTDADIGGLNFLIGAGFFKPVFGETALFMEVGSFTQTLKSGSGYFLQAQGNFFFFSLGVRF